MRLRKESVRATAALGSASGSGRSLDSTDSRINVWLRLLPSLYAVAPIYTTGRSLSVDDS